MITRQPSNDFEFPIPSRHAIQSKAAEIRNHWTAAERNRRRQEAQMRQQQLLTPPVPYAVVAGFTC